MKGFLQCKLKSYTFYLVALLAVFFGSFITYQGNASAVSDISVTYTSVPSNYSSVFPTCSGTCLDDYKYLIIESSFVDWTTQVFSSIEYRFDGSYIRRLYFPYNFSYVVLSLPFKGSPNNLLEFVNTSNVPSDFWSSGVTFTLTDSLGGSAPSGSLSITANGTYDVTNYAEAVVDVPPEIVQADYHDDLVNLKQAVIFVPAVALVLYFFYAIYKMLLGGKTL